MVMNGSSQTDSGCPNFDPCTLDPLEPTILVPSEKELQRRLQFALSDPHFSPRVLGHECCTAAKFVAEPL